MNHVEPTAPHDGTKVFAAILGAIGATPVALVTGTMASSWWGEGWLGLEWMFLLLIPIGAWRGMKMSSTLGAWKWKRYGVLCGVLGFGSFGLVMEGPEGAMWGSLIGLVVGFFYGWYAPWIARTLPGRWGVWIAWSGIYAAFYLIPVVLWIRLTAGRFDDDDSPFILLALVAGIYHARAAGWWNLERFGKKDVMGKISAYLRGWVSPRALPWLIATSISGHIAGPMGAHYHIDAGESLSIRLAPSCWIWPIMLSAAAASGLIVMRRYQGTFNKCYRVLCCIVLFLTALTLVRYTRFQGEVTPDALDLRYGIWKSVQLTPSELLHIETGTARSRRGVMKYTILTHRSGKRHHLLRMPYSHRVKDYLIRNWNTPIDGAS